MVVANLNNDLPTRVTHCDMAYRLSPAPRYSHSEVRGFVLFMIGSQQSKGGSMSDEIYRCRECGAWAMDTICGQCTKMTHGRCKFCDRPMRRRDWPKLDGWINYGGRGYCSVHYGKINDAGTEDILDVELDEAVESYWRNRAFVRAGVEVPVDRS